MRRMIQNNVTKMKRQRRHTNRIKNQTGTWGRKRHPIRLRELQINHKTRKINKNHFIYTVFQHMLHIYDRFYYRRYSKFFRDFITDTHYIDAEWTGVLSETYQAYLEYMLLQQQLFLLSLLAMNMYFVACP